MGGKIYVLINPAMPSLVKIGLTTKSAELRAEQLSSPTGVPSAFVVAYETSVEDPVRVEAVIHERLAKFRWNESREFFQLPLREAILHVEEAIKILSRFNAANPSFCRDKSPLP